MKTNVKTEGTDAIPCSDLLGRITDEEIYHAISGRAAMAEHDANVAQRCGLHGHQLAVVKRHSATLRAAANKLRPNVEVCDGGRKTSELKQDANRHSQH